jgi:hypothetical protein
MFKQRVDLLARAFFRGLHESAENSRRTRLKEELKAADAAMFATANPSGWRI